MSVIYYQSRGRSMEPFLLDGDELIVRGGASPRVGDVALFRSAGGGQVAHRVVAVDAAARVLVARADAYLSTREAVAFADVLGTVEFARRGPRLIRISGTAGARLRNRAIVAVLPLLAALKRALGSRSDREP